MPSEHGRAATSSNHRVADLDGIRAIAIWMVMLMHAYYAFPNPPGAFSSVPKPLMLILGHGWLGVDLFFMLSGFLITGILMGSKSGPHYFRNFYTRRVLRIMPVYFAVIIVWSFFYRGYGRYFLLSSVFCANLAQLLHVRHGGGPAILWSLAVEEHFYLLWPLIVLLLSESALAITAAAIFLITPVLRGIFAAHGMNPELMYELSWFRFDGLAAGALLAIWARSSLAGKRYSIRFALLLVGAFAVLTIVGTPFGLSGTHTPVAAALRYTQAYLIFGAFFVLIVAFRGTVWTSPLRWRFLQLSGALSYCLYLIHHSVGEGYEYLLKRSGIPIVYYVGPSGAVFVRAVVMLGVSFGIALLSRKYLEQPFLSLKDRFTEAEPLKPRPQPASLVDAV
jgi:peptidoglycan/LPS O-acetylase OafA/YrhL